VRNFLISAQAERPLGVDPSGSIMAVRMAGIGANRKQAAPKLGFCLAPKADFDLTRERLANVKDSRAGNFAPS